MLRCLLYMAVTGMIGFALGRLVPKRWFHADRFPYRSAAFEREGRIYECFRIQWWQARVPDMSRIFPHLMPAKNLKQDFIHRLPRMLQETCVAEWIHWLLCLSGLYLLRLWPGAGGIVMTVLYILLGNLPFILVQRYNRPRLLRLYQRLQRKREKKEGKFD